MYSFLFVFGSQLFPESFNVQFKVRIIPRNIPLKKRLDIRIIINIVLGHSNHPLRQIISTTVHLPHLRRFGNLGSSPHVIRCGGCRSLLGKGSCHGKSRITFSSPSSAAYFDVCAAFGLTCHLSVLGWTRRRPHHHHPGGHQHWKWFGYGTLWSVRLLQIWNTLWIVWRAN